MAWIEGLRAHFKVLWRHTEWRCEYAPNTRRAGGTVSLFMGSALIVEYEARSLDDMLRVSSVWREVVVGREEMDPRIDIRLVPVPDRRLRIKDRRASYRGGRRAEDRA